MYMDLKIKELTVYEVKIIYTTYRFDTKEEAVIFQVGYKDGLSNSEENGSSASYMLGHQAGLAHSDKELKKYGMDMYCVAKGKLNDSKLKS